MWIHPERAARIIDSTATMEREALLICAVNERKYCVSPDDFWFPLRILIATFYSNSHPLIDVARFTGNVLEMCFPTNKKSTFRFSQDTQTKNNHLRNFFCRMLVDESAK